MIKSFADKETRKVWERGRSGAIPGNLQRKALQKLEQLDVVDNLDELRAPPGNRLERLGGDRAGQHSIRINRQYRVCFTWDDGDAYEVEIVDYH